MPETSSIYYLTNREINKTLWDKTIDNAENGLIYAYSAYLDAMCTNWDALILYNYEAVMPLPYRTKYGISYLYQPAFIAQLGLFGNNLSPNLLESFLQFIPTKFKYLDFPLNYNNVFAVKFPLFLRMNYILDLNRDYEEIYKNYTQNLKLVLKKGAKFNDNIKTKIPVEEIISISKKQLTNTSITEQDYTSFKKLFHLFNKTGNAKTYGFLSNDGKLLASAIFLFSHKRAYYVLAGNDLEGRKVNASSYVIDAFIKDHSRKHIILDFEGSDIPGIAFFFRNFGASEEKYTAIKMNRLPWFLKWLK